MDILTYLQEPLNYQFMQRAMLAIVLIGAISGVVGCYVVVRGMAFFGDALAHTIVPGVAVSYVAAGGAIGSHLFIGGLVAGVISALGIGWLTRKGQMKEDTAIGLVFVAMFALGVAIISTQGSYSVDLAHILFGSILGISEADLIIMAIFGGVVLLLVIIFYREFLVLSFDPGLARTLKLPAETLRMLLLVLVAVTIVASLQAVGVALMLALLVAPAATAQLLVKRLHWMMLLSAVIGVVCGVVGAYLSYYSDIPAGAAIVLMMTGVFAVTFGITRLLQSRT